MQQNLMDFLSEENPEALLADGFEDAFIGICEVFNRPLLAAYDRRKCIDILMTRDGMTEEDAEEYFSFNVSGAWLGDGTPVYVSLQVSK
jgi:hypothetical protein